jgi:hypothetical protein
MAEHLAETAENGKELLDRGTSEDRLPTSV